MTVAHAMERWVYFFDLMRIKKLSEVCVELKKKYDPTGPTEYDERATFTQLEMDLVNFEVQSQILEMDQQLYLPVDSSNSKSEECEDMIWGERTSLRR